MIFISTSIRWKVCLTMTSDMRSKRHKTCYQHGCVWYTYCRIDRAIALGCWFCRQIVKVTSFRRVHLLHWNDPAMHGYDWCYFLEKYITVIFIPIVHRFGYRNGRNARAAVHLAGRVNFETLPKLSRSFGGRLSNTCSYLLFNNIRDQNFL